MPAVEPFRYSEQFNLLICTLCRKAVSTSSLKRHLSGSGHRQQDHHRDQYLDQLCQWFKELGINPVANLDDVKLLHEPVGVVPGLPLFADGFKCLDEKKKCPLGRYIVRNRGDMQKHLREKHGWVNTETRGGYRKGRQLDQGPWKEGVYCQQLVTKGVLFEVRPAPDAGEWEQTTTYRVRGHDEKMWKRRMEEDQARSTALVHQIFADMRATVETSEKGEVNAWLDRTGWAAHLKGKDRSAMSKLLQKPENDSEPLLTDIEARFRKITVVAQQTTISRVNHFVRFAINSKDDSKHPSRPFNPLMEASTMTHYQDWFAEIIRFTIRTWDFDRQQGAAATDQEDAAIAQEPYGESTLISTTSARALRPRSQPSEVVASSSSEASDDEEDQNFEPEPASREQFRRQRGEVPRATRPDSRELDTTPPDYQLTPTQHDFTDNVVDMVRKSIGGVRAGAEEPTNLDETDFAVLEWLVSLFDDHLSGTQGTEFKSVVLSALAVAAIRKDGGWESVLNYTPRLSAIIKITRLLVVQYAFETSKWRGNDILALVEEKVRTFMMIRKATPMGWIFNTRSYGFKIRYTEAAEGSIHWIGDRVRYQDVEFSLPQLQTMVHGLVGQAWETLTEKLLLFSTDEAQAGVPPVLWESLYDDASNNAWGWSFLHDQRSKWPVDGQRWLHERMWTKKRDAFIIADEDPFWNRRKVEDWLRSVVNFKEMLLVLMHITGGQPARGPEILSLRFRNTSNGGRRNVFIEDGMVLFVTEYHKGYASSGRTKAIHRYLPREVGELLVYYLWLVMPMQHSFEAQMLCSRWIQPFLWTSQADVDGRKWTSERLKRLLVAFSRASMGTRLTIRSYRQTAIAISRKHTRGHFQFDNIGTPDEEVLLDEADADEEGCWWASDDDPRDLQAGHGSYVAGLSYARGIEEAPNSMFSMREKFRQISCEWHRVLGFPPALSGDECGSLSRKRKRGQQELEGSRWADIQKLTRMRQVDIGAILTRLLGPAARFRGIQQEAITAVMGGVARVLAIMGTGAGKSLTFMLPAAWSEAQTTVVVVPMTALRADLKRRCQQARLRCAEWNANWPEEDSTIVLVTPECVIQKKFQSFLHRLHVSRRLDRIVIDECHTVLDSTDKFRPLMGQLQRLFTVGCPLLMLTATLPPTDEGAFLREMTIGDVKTQVYRAPTTRSNVAYSVETLDRWEQTAIELRQALSSTEENAETRGKWIVYTRRKVDAEKIAHRLECPFFHADILEARKTEVLKGLRTGDTKGVVATNALGLGVDVPDIRTVVHLGAPDSLRDYAQESGRAGRDGLPSRAVIFEHRPKVGSPRPAGERGGGTEEMRAFLAQRTCRRIVLDRYLDGCQQRTRCRQRTDEEAECDNCLRARTVVKSIAKLAQEVTTAHADQVAEQVAEQEQEFETLRRNQAQTAAQVADSELRLKQHLERWKGKCAVCLSQGSPHAGTHRMQDCDRLEASDIWRRVQRMRAPGGIRYAPYSCCFRCGTPQWVCRRYEPTDRGGWLAVKSETCQFEGILMEVVATAIALNVEGLKGAIQKRMQAEGWDAETDYQMLICFGKILRWTRGSRSQVNGLTVAFWQVAETLQV